MEFGREELLVVLADALEHFLDLPGEVLWAEGCLVGLPGDQDRASPRQELLHGLNQAGEDRMAKRLYPGLILGG